MQPNFAFIVHVLPYISWTTLRYSVHYQGMLHHSFHGAEITWTRLVRSLWASEQTRFQVSTHLNVSYESGCNRCWPDICQGPWELWGASLQRRPHSLLSFVARANCELRWTASCTMYPSVHGPGTNWFTQVLIQHRASKDALISFSLCSP